jgi:serine/threonine protein kinase
MSATVVERLGKYELVELLARGGMAEVYKARLPGAAGFAKTVVIKRMLPEISRRSDMVQMFIGEAKLASEVHHQNIVEVLALEEMESGELYMVLEYVEGSDLRRILQTSTKAKIRLPPWFSVKVIVDILQGLSFAHELKDERGKLRNIVHRDVTPSNIFLSKRGEVKLADFGVAKDYGRQEKTVTGFMKGKLAYMSPEQLYHRPLDQRSDIFAAGVVLWEMLAQKRLFGGNRPEIETMNLICSGDRRPPSEICSDVPKELDACVLCALRPSPSERFLTSRDFQARLIEILHRMRPRILPSDVLAVLEQTVSGKGEARLAQIRAPSDSGKASFEVSSHAKPVEPTIKLDSDLIDVAVARPSAPPPRTAYEGTYPFWVERGHEQSGPHAYFDALVLLRESQGPRSISVDGKAFMAVEEFGALTGQEALFAREGVTLPIPPNAMSPTALLADLANRKRTVRLEIATHRGTRQARAEIILEAGQIAFVGSNLFRLQLPEVLTSMGSITTAQLPELFFTVIERKVPLEVVVAEVVAEPSSPEAVRHRLLRDRLAAVLDFTIEGLSIEEIPPSGRPSLPVLPLLHELIATAIGEVGLSQRLGSLKGDRFRIGRGFATRLFQCGFDPRAFDIARALARGEPIDTLIRAAPSDRRSIYAVAYLLNETGLIAPS